MTHCLIIGGHIGIGFYDDVVVLDTSDIEELPQGPGNVDIDNTVFMVDGD